MNDNELREAFRALAAQDTQSAPPFSRTRVESRRHSVHSRRRRVWFTASGIAVAAVAAVLFAVVPRQELLELDLTGTRIVPATDFLLNTPGRSLMRTVPAIGVITTPPRSAESPSRVDTSGRDK